MAYKTRVRLSEHARRLALEIVAEARAEWGYTSEIIARAFRAHRALPSGDRRRVSETVYGLIRLHRRIDAVVDEWVAGQRGGAPVLSPQARDELRLLVYELRTEAAPLPAVNTDARRVVGVAVDLASTAAEGAGLGTAAGIEREALRLSHPTWLMQRLSDQLGADEAAHLAGSMNQRAPLTIRANTARTTREALAARLADEGVQARATVLAPAGLVLETRVNAFGLSAFRDGLFEVMDEGSQLVAEVVAPPPAGKVVDACAGAGGKTLALGAVMGGKGRLLALDVDGRKLEELRRRARRAGLTNVTARQVGGDGGALPAEARPGGWDRVLVDAPCSGLGTLRRNPEARWRLTPDVVDAFPARQVALLITYAPLCAVGGRLIYATCTPLADENDRVVDRFCAERDDFVRVPLKEIWGRELAAKVGDDHVLRIFPHTHDTDAFYAAVLRRIR